MQLKREQPEKESETLVLILNDHLSLCLNPNIIENSEDNHHDRHHP
jgi:hypothetical protein